MLELPLPASIVWSNLKFLKNFQVSFITKHVDSKFTIQSVFKGAALFEFRDTHKRSPCYCWIHHLEHEWNMDKLTNSLLLRPQCEKDFISLTPLISVRHAHWPTLCSVHFHTLQRQWKSTFKPLLWSKHAAQTAVVPTQDYGLIEHHTISVCQRQCSLYTLNTHISTHTTWSLLAYRAEPLPVLWLFLGSVILFPGGYSWLYKCQ